MGGSGIIANVCTGVVAVVALITALVFRGKAKEAEKSRRDALAQIEEQSKQLKELGTMDKKLESENKTLKESRNYKSLLEEVTGEIGNVRDEIKNRAFGEKGEQQCWDAGEMIGWLFRTKPNVGTEQNDGTILTGRIEKLETFRGRLKGIVYEEKDKYKEKIDSISCEGARELIDEIVKAGDSLFAACVEGHENNYEELSALINDLLHCTYMIDEKGGIKVEYSSSPDDASESQGGVNGLDAGRLQYELNDLLGLLNDHAYKASHYIRTPRSDAEVKFYKVISGVADCPQEES